MDWEEAGDHIEGYFEYTLGLESEREKAIWTYVISVAVHLEYMAVLIHWHDAGQPTGFNEYGRGLTLAQAAFDLEARGLIGNETFAVLRDVAVLRNGLAHHHAYRQAAEQTGFRRQDRGIYRGRHVFTRDRPAEIRRAPPAPVFNQSVPLPRTRQRGWPRRSKAACRSMRSGIAKLKREALGGRRRANGGAYVRLG